MRICKRCIAPASDAVANVMTSGDNSALFIRPVRSSKVPNVFHDDVSNNRHSNDHIIVVFTDSTVQRCKEQGRNIDSRSYPLNN